MHAWAEALLPNGAWISADPSVEQLRKLGRTSKRGGFGFVGSDRIALSRGCDFDLEMGGKTLRVDILQNPIVHSSGGEGSVAVKHEFLTRRIGI
jgi:transglutaminase-like putative cysteine protease